MVLRHTSKNSFFVQAFGDSCIYSRKPYNNTPTFGNPANLLDFPSTVTNDPWENPSPVPSSKVSHMASVASSDYQPTAFSQKIPEFSIRQPTFRSLRWICVVDIVSKSCFLAKKKKAKKRGKEKNPPFKPPPPAKYIERENKGGVTGQLKKKKQLTGTRCFLLLHVLPPLTH